MRYSICLVFVIFISGCSNVEFINSSNGFVSLSPRHGHNDTYSKNLVAEQYLWGTLPNKIIFDLADIKDEFELESIASLEIKKESRVESYLWPIFTLGFVTPKYFVLTFKGM